MENVVLTVHLILALLLIGIVLLQRSEGGGLGLGGGGGGGVMTGRQAANALSRLTWILAAAFLATSLTLTVMAARNSNGGSVTDQIGFGSGSQNTEQSSTAPALPNYAPPPGVGQPIAPPSPEAAAPAAAETAAPAAADAPVTPPAAN